jgi:hypothetical protein
LLEGLIIELMIFGFKCRRKTSQCDANFELVSALNVFIGTG